MPTLLEIERDGDLFVLRSQNPYIRESICSWGSYGTGMNIRETPEFYGRSLSGPVQFPDRERWEWRLSRGSVDLLIQWSRKALEQPKKYRMTRKDVAASKRVIDVLEKALKEIT